MDQRKIGKYIADKRKEKGLTQSQLAENLNVGEKSVSKWERGVCLPDVSKYQDLCKILGVSLNEFFAGEDIEEESVVIQSEKNILNIVNTEKNKRNKLKALIIVLLLLVLSIGLWYMKTEYLVVVRDTENLGWLTYEMPEEGYIHLEEDTVVEGDKIVGKIYRSERNDTRISVIELDYESEIEDENNANGVETFKGTYLPSFVKNIVISCGKSNDEIYPYYYKAYIETDIEGFEKKYAINVDGQFKDGVVFLGEELIKSMNWDTALEVEHVKGPWVLF
ncbi:MAG: helix-turn-helix transcriptional regulator [Firmicutes bacterium]|nr:helix-turn-helix transcriptional regulator [Bacillota bacterium]